MRRHDRQVTDTPQLLEIMDECMVCRLGLRDENGMYIVPMNFGYTYDAAAESIVLYFHSAPNGRKIEAIRQNPQVCFQMDAHHELIEADVACRYGYYYSSIHGSGQMTIVEDVSEKKLALETLMGHQTNLSFEFTDAMTKNITILKLDVRELTGKKNENRSNNDNRNQ